MELKGTFVRRGSTLVPANAMAEEELRQFPQEQPIRVTARTTRSAKQLNFCWALATIVAEGMGEQSDKEDGMSFLCTEAKHIRIVMHPVTKIWEAKRKSIANLSREAFTRLIHRFVYTIVHDVMPGQGRDIRRRLEEVLRGDRDLPEHLKAFDEAANAALGRKVA